MTPAKAESSTKSGVNAASTVSNKSANPVVAARPVPKVKLPSGVLPILDIIDTNFEANVKPDDRRKDDADENGAAVKLANGNDDSKNHQKIQAVNAIVQAPGQPGRRHFGEEILHRQNDANWFREKGVQEIGEIGDFGNNGKVEWVINRD